MRLKILFAAVLLSTVAVQPVSAQLLTFDDIASSGNPNATVYVPTSYMGFTFGGTTTTNGCGFAGECDWVTNRDFWAPSFPSSVSSPVSLWATAVGTLTLSRASTFTFNSAYLGAAYGVCGQVTPTITITSYLGATLVNSTVRNLSCNTFVQETFNWSNINRVEFSAASVSVNRTFDNILLSNAAVVTPEPETFVLLGAGIAALAVVRRRRSSI